MQLKSFPYLAKRKRGEYRFEKEGEEVKQLAKIRDKSCESILLSYFESTSFSWLTNSHYKDIT